ncbi:glycosyl transferase [Streptococcus pneumoniae]|nr:glycosyltransferase [Streptococcus pneumoniae]SND61320.1 glycosyl transferase [Streptococcus pneumoniae]
MTQNVESLLVSIVISAYNEEKYLPSLIEDLKNQTYQDNTWNKKE